MFQAGDPEGGPRRAAQGFGRRQPRGSGRRDHPGGPGGFRRAQDRRYVPRVLQAVQHDDRRRLFGGHILPCPPRTLADGEDPLRFHEVGHAAENGFRHRKRSAGAGFRAIQESGAIFVRAGNDQGFQRNRRLQGFFDEFGAFQEQQGVVRMIAQVSEFFKKRVLAARDDQGSSVLPIRCRSHSRAAPRLKAGDEFMRQPGIRSFPPT